MLQRTPVNKNILNHDFIYQLKKKISKPRPTLCEKNEWLFNLTTLQQEMQSSICDIWKWVFHISVEDSSLQNCFSSATLEGFWARRACLRLWKAVGFKSDVWLGLSTSFFWAIQRWTYWFVFDVLLHNCQDSLLESRTNGSITYSKSFRSWSMKGAPDHQTNTNIFDCRYGILAKCELSHCLVLVVFTLERSHFSSASFLLLHYELWS